jgi:hypothetical protein
VGEVSVERSLAGEQLPELDESDGDVVEVSEYARFGVLEGDLVDPRSWEDNPAGSVRDYREWKALGSTVIARLPDGISDCAL